MKKRSRGKGIEINFILLLFSSLLHLVYITTSTVGRQKGRHRCCCFCCYYLEPLLIIATVACVDVILHVKCVIERYIRVKMCMKKNKNLGRRFGKFFLLSNFIFVKHSKTFIRMICSVGSYFVSIKSSCFIMKANVPLCYDDDYELLFSFFPYKNMMMIV